MPLIKKTYEELVELELAEVHTRLPELDTSPGSDAEVNARGHAMLVHLSQAQAEYLSKQIFAADADEPNLRKSADELGVPIPGDAQAEGLVVVYSSAPATLNAGESLSHLTGKEYVTTESRTTSLPDYATSELREVGGLSNEYRIHVVPNVVGIYPLDHVSIDGERRVVREVIGGISSIELYDPLPSVPATGTQVSSDSIYSAVVPVRSVETGSDKNLPVGSSLTISNAPANMEATATVLEMTGGGDAATLEEIRRDVLARKAVRPAGGNEAQYRAIAKATPLCRLEDAFVYRGLFGAGTIVVVPFGVSGSRLTGSLTNERVHDELRSKMPFVDDLAVMSWNPLFPAVDVTISVRPGVGFEPDVSDEHSLAASGSTSTSLLVGGVSGSFEPGDRIVAEVDVGHGFIISQERVILSVARDGSNTTLELDGALDGEPVASSTIRGGGPLWQQIRDAIEEIFDELGPGDTDIVGLSEFGTRWPRPSEAWPAVLYPDAITRRVGAIEGVIEARNGSPAHGEPISPPPLYRLQLGRTGVTWLL